MSSFAAEPAKVGLVSHNGAAIKPLARDAGRTHAPARNMRKLMPEEHHGAWIARTSRDDDVLAWQRADH